MMLTCSHCKSQSIVYDREYVAGAGYVDRPRCLKCGRDKFEEVEQSGCAGAVTRMPIGQENSQSAKKVNALRDNRPSGSACDTVSTKTPNGLNLPDVIAQSGSPSPGAHSMKVESDHDESGTSPMQMGERLKKEGKRMAGHKKCKVEGCKKSGQFFGNCAAHFRAMYGITYGQYTTNRRETGEDPQVVALRVENKDEADRIKRGQDAKETFDQAMAEEKEKNMGMKQETPIPAGAAKPAPPPPPPKPYTNHVVKQETKAPVSGKPEAKAWPGEDVAKKSVISDERVSFPMDISSALFSKLEDKAKEEYRTPELQAAYMLDRALRGEG
ncbi:MAG: hypothetical protein ACYDHW_10870 [Syntrophorhabdaceae bacterium]